MSLLSFLTGSGSVVAAGPQGGAKPRQTAPASKSNSSARVVPLKARATQAPTQHKVYLQTADLPEWESLASAADGEFPLRRPKDHESIFILKLKEGPGVYSVMASREVYGSAAYKAEVQRIEAAGYKVKYCGVADGPLIARMYADEEDEKGSGQLDIKPIVKDIDELCEAALSLSASDIHIEKRLGYTKVFMRINGRLEQYSNAWLPEYTLQMARALHTIADEDSKDTTFSPVGNMSVSRALPSGSRIKLRVQMSAAYPDEGMDIVIRVLRDAATVRVKDLNELGYSPDHVEMFEYMLTSPHGLIIVAGTTGSGKSTTLQTAMMHIRKSDSGLKLISVEDPPEYVMDGVTQIPVVRRRNAKDGSNAFTDAMRNTLRMDPDVLMVGEVRDQETAVLLTAMVQSGHKALSTIHTESALGVVPRLASMGVGGDILGAKGFIAGLIFQTLVPVLCDSCKIDYDPTSTAISPALHERIKRVTRPGDTIFLAATNTAEHPNKCPHCRGTGISGRTVCAEMVVPNAEMREAFRENNLARAYKLWRSLRAGHPESSSIGATALEHALLKMRRGEVSPRDVEGSLGLLYDFNQESDPVQAEALNVLGVSK